jgi:GH18 family chitinase
LESEKIDEAMHAGKENGTHSKTKFRFIGYFTAWQDTDRFCIL